MTVDDLPQAAQDLASYLPILELLLREPDDTGQPMVTMTGATRSAPPWNPAAAAVLFDAHEGIRRLEQDMRQQVTGELHGRRGGSDAATYRALKAVIALGEAVTHGAAEDAVRLLSRWAEAARRLPAIDEAPVWVPIRAASFCAACGAKLPQPTPEVCPACGREVDPHRCPYCRTPSLRVAKASGVVECFAPGCADSRGNRPTGRLDRSRIDGAPVLAWDDGLVQGAQ